VNEHQSLPDTNRLSILAAMILLAYASVPFIHLPERSLSLQLPGFLFVLQFNFATVLSILIAALAAAGVNWLVQGHPQIGDQSTVQHWLLPALTAWAIGVPLGTLAIGLQWWAVFAFGGILLVLVCVAEYIVVDVTDVREPPATVGLTAVSFALYLTLAIAIHAAGLRLYMLLPALVPTIGLVTLRTLYLRLGGRWMWAWATGIAIIIGQIALGLHYWPISSLSYGLALLGPAYALTSLAGAIEENRTLQTLWIEPVIMLIAFWGLAVIFR
jgi:hypothetical protein